MNTVRRTLVKSIGIGLLCLAFPGPASATDSPLEVIQTTMHKIVAILQDPAYQDPDQSQVRIQKVREVALPQFDSREIAKRTLGIHWRDRTEEQRQEFIRLFTDLIEKTYSSTLDRYREDTEFFFDREHIDGSYAEVDSRILSPLAEQHLLAELPSAPGRRTLVDLRCGDRERQHGPQLSDPIQPDHQQIVV